MIINNMKKFIFVIIFLFLSISLFSQNKSLQYFNYSIFYNSEENNYNHAVSTDLYFTLNNNMENNIGIKYIFNYNILSIRYSLIIDFDQVFKYNINIPLFGIGINISYNINNNIFGISPQVDLTSSLSYIKFNLAYRYNININYINSHDIELTIGFLNIFLLKELLE